MLKNIPTVPGRPLASAGSAFDHTVVIEELFAATALVITVPV
jgi:hypothetical protein